MKFWLLALVCVTTAVKADPKDFYYKRFAEGAFSSPRNLPAGIATGTFEQKVDPANSSDTRTFKQRYYTNSAYAENANSPVLFYLCGEATCESNSVVGGATVNHAKKLKAHVVALEHRYYGKSQPFSELTTENLKYLSTENALLDAAAFIKYAAKNLNLKGKWLVVGGSYAGSLSAFMRMKFPDLVVGSLASSGPVQAKEKFEEYDKHVATVAGPACLANIKKVVGEVETALTNGAELEKIKKKFLAAELKDDTDFLYFVADMAALAIQYGYTTRFCSLLAKSPMDGYATFISEIFASWGINAISMSAQGATSINPDDYVAGFGMRQWMYQSCTEYGYWQVAYSDENLSARSKMIDLDYHRNICKRLFGLTTPVDEAATNDALYKPLLEGSNDRIYFTNGSTDPWMNLSIAKELGNLTNPGHLGRTITGASHCSDLSGAASAAPVLASQAEFLKLATEWLK